MEIMFLRKRRKKKLQDFCLITSFESKENSTVDLKSKIEYQIFEEI